MNLRIRRKKYKQMRDAYLCSFTSEGITKRNLKKMRKAMKEVSQGALKDRVLKGLENLARTVVSRDWNFKLLP